MADTKHILSLLVENKPGVLSRVTGLISRRGFNIESLSVAPTDDTNMSRLTAVIICDEVAFEQIQKQLHKLISVYKITDLSNDEYVERSLVLYKVHALPEKRGEIIAIADVFRAKVIDVGKTSITLQVTGPERKIKGIEDLLRAYGIKEVIRTGMVAMSRGQKMN